MLIYLIASILFMDLIFVGAFLFVLGILALEDIRTRKLADILLAILWMLMVIGHSIELAGLAFAFAFLLLYAAPICFWKRPIVRWGDVLLLPPLIAFCSVVGGLTGIYFAILMLGFTLIVSFKKELPFAAICFGTALIVVICALFGAG
jgi:hypothetical protein